VRVETFGGGGARRLIPCNPMMVGIWSQNLKLLEPYFNEIGPIQMIYARAAPRKKLETDFNFPNTLISHLGRRATK
jgi:hypothetical protein